MAPNFFHRKVISFLNSFWVLTISPNSGERNKIGDTQCDPKAAAWNTLRSNFGKMEFLGWFYFDATVFVLTMLLNGDGAVWQFKNVAIMSVDYSVWNQKEV